MRSSRGRDLVIFLFVVAVFSLLAVRDEIMDRRLDALVAEAEVQRLKECATGALTINELGVMLERLAALEESKPDTKFESVRHQRARIYREAITPYPVSLCGYTGERP